MALHTYRYRRDAPFTTAQLVKLVAPSALNVAGAGGPVYDIQVDDSRLADLDEIMASAGYTNIATDPAGTPVTQIRVGDGTILTVGSLLDGEFARRSGSLLIGAASTFDPRDVLVAEHFVSSNATSLDFGNYNWRRSNAGTGNNLLLVGEAGHPGIARLLAGTVAMGRSAISIGDGFENIIIGGTAALVFECLVSPRVSVSGIDLLRHEAGLGLGWNSGNPTDLSDGVFWRFEPLLNANFVGVSRASSIETVRASTTAPVLGNWYRLGFTATATSVQFTLNGVAVGAPVTTNISAVLTSLGFISRAVGSGVNPELLIDYALLTQVTNKET